ncbi:MAG: endonuclease/exonuclease/phosphatase family protein, partial [Thiohalobacteraceae bacterium]
GYGLEAAVDAAFDKLRPPVPHADRGGLSTQTHRVRLLGGKKTQRLFSALGGNGGDVGDERTTRIAALGPIAHVYIPGARDDALRTRVAHELATTHKVPVVLVRDGSGALHAWTETGKFRIPLDAGRLFGAQHPFIDALGPDLLRLCEHPDAGDLVLLGWRDGLAPISFATENGAHAGPTPDETHGFALLPDDAQLAAHERRYLRPLDLRHAALHQLGRENPAANRTRRRPAAVPTDDLRIMTYNVHSCVGMDGKLDAERVARVIARAKPDVVALQELDVGRLRSQSMDQAHLIARYLEMDFHFHPALHLEEERYGDAILTHLPLRLVKAGALPGLADKPRLEPRGVLWVAIDLHGTEVQVINTHLGLYPRERLAQVEALLGADWLAHPDCRDPVILCGDFNAMPSSPVCRHFGRRLRDAQIVAPGHRPKATFSSRFPSLRIDHIFIGAGIEVSGIQIPRSQLARIASDHLPLLAELRIARQRETSAGAGFPVGTPTTSE